METFLAERPVPRGVAYFTDASILTPAFDNPPTVILGPGEPAMAHKTDEFCHIAKIEQAAEAYFELARRWNEQIGNRFGTRSSAASHTESSVKAQLKKDQLSI